MLAMASQAAEAFADAANIRHGALGESPGEELLDATCEATGPGSPAYRKTASTSRATDATAAAASEPPPSALASKKELSAPRALPSVVDLRPREEKAVGVNDSYDCAGRCLA